MAVDADGLVRRMTAPDRERVLRSQAAEPQVDGIGGGAGLAREGLVDREARAVRRAAAVLDDALEHLDDRVVYGGIDNLLGGIFMLVDDLAIAVGDLRDRDGVTMHAAGREGGIGLGHLERGKRGHAQGERGNILHGGGVDAQPAAHIDDLVVANGLGNLHVAGVR